MCAVEFRPKFDLSRRNQPSTGKKGSQQLDADRLNEALNRLDDRLCTPAIYASLLQQCGKGQALAEGRKIHLHIVAKGYEHDRYLCNLLVQMYGKCGSLGEAFWVFEKISNKNVFSWNIMVAAFAQNGHLTEARRMFDEMPERDSVSWNEMIGAYCRNGMLMRAKECFDRMPLPDVVSWTLIASAYGERGEFQRAILQFRLMDLEGIRPDKVMFVIALDACASLGSLEDGSLIHSCVEQSDVALSVVIRTTLVNMYGKCGAVDPARSVFDDCVDLHNAANIPLWNAMIAAYAQNDRLQEAVILFRKLPIKDVVSWNTMVAAFAQNNCGKEALRVLGSLDLEGVEANEITFIAAIDACSKLEDLRRAEAIHACVIDSGFQSDIRIGNALVNMYGKCGSARLARAVFEGMIEKNVVSWSGLVSAYSHNCCFDQSLAAYRRMNLEGVKPNAVTLLGAIDACAGAASSADARLIHSNLKEFGKIADPVLGNAVVNMHAKCGNLSSAMELFNELPRKTVVSWNTMIGAYAHCSQDDDGDGLELFRRMSLEGEADPNEACFTSVFSICNHAGRLDDASRCFESMVADYGLTPLTEHYHCLIDLLGRAGRLAEVEELICGMPFQPDLIAWTAFVDACKTQGEFGKGGCAAGRMFGLGGKTLGNSGAYALLSNMYASLSVDQPSANGLRN